MRPQTFEVVILALLLPVTGCVRRAGRNSDCRWPAEPIQHSADARHLSADAEFAEDLAIRYADTHHGLRTRHYVSGDAYNAARDRCLEGLFEEIARTHGTSNATVFNSLGRNRDYIDLAMILPIVLLYGFGAVAMAGAVWQRYSSAENGWVPGAVMILCLSLVFAAGGAMLGELWCWYAESIRIGNGHMSYRGQRLWWVRHRSELFAGGATVFWLAGVRAARRMRRIRPVPAL